VVFSTGKQEFSTGFPQVKWGLRIRNTQITHLSINIMQVTYAQLFKFMGTFTNQELDDAQTIAEHAHQDLGKSYNQVLVDVLVEMRQHQLVN
jgi:hypothetical protein